MILPGKSGVDIEGMLNGTELATPRSLLPRPMENRCSRSVCFTDLDLNGHMNNSRYLDWLMDLLPSDFHRDHPVKDFTLCYMNEAREGQTLDLAWEVDAQGALNVDIQRPKGDDHDRIFAAKLEFESGVL
jgi:acyl-ACP thioesterase